MISTFPVLPPSRLNWAHSFQHNLAPIKTTPLRVRHTSIGDGLSLSPKSQTYWMKYIILHTMMHLVVGTCSTHLHNNMFINKVCETWIPVMWPMSWKLGVNFQLSIRILTNELCHPPLTLNTSYIFIHDFPCICVFSHLHHTTKNSNIFLP